MNSKVICIVLAANNVFTKLFSVYTRIVMQLKVVATHTALFLTAYGEYGGRAKVELTFRRAR